MFAKSNCFSDAASRNVMNHLAWYKDTTAFYRAGNSRLCYVMELKQLTWLDPVCTIMH